LLRAVRRARMLSQRELAALAEVRPSTVDRIESGRTPTPSLALVERILRAAGHALVIADEHGRLLELDDERLRLFDRAYRRFPAHLPAQRIQGYPYEWWGWSRIAWQLNDPKVPTWTFYKRGKYFGWKYSWTDDWPMQEVT
jgi:transcriptional regulator with XRE-family HTH domain